MRRTCGLVALTLVMVFGVPFATGAAEKPGGEMTVASGTFNVKLEPQAASEKGQQSGVGRMSIDKQFAGDLEGTSSGEMLMVRTAVEGSAGYVALEKVAGRLAGRDGTFVLQHHGIMDRGKPQLTITVVPDSGTGGLAGITGSMEIEITEGKHSYRFRYTLPEAGR